MGNELGGGAMTSGGVLDAESPDVEKRGRRMGKSRDAEVDGKGGWQLISEGAWTRRLEQGKHS